MAKSARALGVGIGDRFEVVEHQRARGVGHERQDPVVQVLTERHTERLRDLVDRLLPRVRTVTPDVEPPPPVVRRLGTAVRGTAAGAESPHPDGR